MGTLDKWDECRSTAAERRAVSVSLYDDDAGDDDNAIMKWNRMTDIACEG